MNGSNLFFSALVPGLHSIAGNGVPQWVTSDLTKLECRVRPVRDSDHELLRGYDEFFAALHMVLPLSRAVVDEATRIRAKFGFKTPDSLHLAAAVVSNCDVFYTNDYRLDRFGGLTIRVV